MSKVVVLKNIPPDEIDGWEKTLREVFKATNIKRTKQDDDDFTLEGTVAD
jgi:hypothetical protein